MIRIVVADDHQLVREGIRAVVALADDIEVVGEATTGEEALRLATDEKPDVLVLDITMPVLGGMEVTTRIKELNLPTEIVILSMHSDPSVIREAMRVGARGYVLKGSVADELILAIRSANRGATYLTTVASDSLLTGEPQAESGPPPEVQLTDREWQVLQLIGDGLTNRAIGHELGISMKTVERHRTNMMSKLDVHTVVDLVRSGIRLGAIQLDD